MALRNIFHAIRKKIQKKGIPIPPFREIGKDEEQEWEWFINGKETKLSSLAGFNKKRGILCGYGVFEQKFLNKSIKFMGPVFAEVGGGGAIGIRYCWKDNIVYLGTTWQTRFGIFSMEFPGGYRDIGESAKDAEKKEVREETGFIDPGIRESVNLTERYCKGLTSAYRYVSDEHPGISVFAQEILQETIDWTQSPPVIKQQYKDPKIKHGDLEFYPFTTIRTMEEFRQADQHAALSLFEQYLIDKGKYTITFSQ